MSPPTSGKCHEVPPYEVSVSGPFDRWPARSGFDKFYGYLAGEQSSLHPNLIDGVTHIGTPKDPEYHFNIDMTDQAIAWVRATRSLTPDRPFLMYYSSSTGHPPHTPPKSWLEKGLCHGRVRSGLGRDAGADFATPEGDGHRPARHQAGRQSGLHPGLGQPVR
jgi:arylsulfatase A-like enzyme